MMAGIDWGGHFDRGFCFHFMPQGAKWERLVRETERTGLADWEAFSMRFTFPSRYDSVVFGDAKGAVSAGCVNLGYAVLAAIEEALFCGCRRVLFMENDVAFLSDLHLAGRILGSMPEDADIWQMDNFVAPFGVQRYEALKKGRRSGEFFFDAGAEVLYSGALFALSRRGMEEMRGALHRELVPPDSLFSELAERGLKRVVSDFPVAVQMVYRGSESERLWGILSHHDGYMRGGVDYSRYHLPEGYGYGSAL